jgi:hypothetical protein
MPKGENFSLQRLEQPGYGVPNQTAKIAHRNDYQPIRGKSAAFWVYGRDTPLFQHSSRFGCGR